MRRAILVWSVALGVYAFVAGNGCGQTVAPAAADDAVKQAEVAASEKVGSDTSRAAEGQPKPEELLRQMADYVCGLPAFSCSVSFSIKIEAQGRKNESTTKVIVRLQRPNKLAMLVESGPAGVTVVSDGKELVQFVPSMNRYVVGEAPADFAKWEDSDAAMLGGAGALLPTDSEQFYKKLMSGVTGSEYLGTEKVGDVECHHCKFLQEDYNWELWIEAGKRPLARKFVPDYSQRFGGGEDTKLEYMVTFTDWDVAPTFAAADFKFEPPAGAEKVDSLFEGMEEDEEGPHPLLGQEAPKFETVDLEGKPIDLKSYLGKNIVMLDFWATWCGPCVQAMPQIDGVAKKFADRGLVFYGVNVGEDADTIKEFLKASELEVPVAMDVEGKIAGLYQADGIPQTVLIGKDGKVQVVHVGFSSSLGKELTKEVEDLLAGKDLATEVLAKAAEAKKKRAAPKKDVSSAGVKPAWSLPGRWTGVATAASSDTVYATGGDKGVVVVDAAGDVKQEIATKGGGTLRLANLVGDGTPEIVLFEAWQSGVKALNATGEPLWEYPPGDGVDDVWAADINGDGMDEVIVGFNGGTGLHVLDNRGTPLWKFTDIGNVWHVTAGDFNQDGNSDVVSTSAAGDLHVFTVDGRKLKDIDLSIYGNMVRMATPGDGSILAIVTGTGSQGEALVGVDYEGNEKFVVALPTSGVDHVDDMAIATTVPWAAVAMRGGLVNVVDVDSGQVVARAADQGTTSQVAWLTRRDKTPLLVVATGSGLNAFDVTPIEPMEADETTNDVEVADDADGASESANSSGDDAVQR